MKTYLVRVKVEIPAPREFDYREQASNASAAIGRALRQFRHDIPRKQIKEFKIHATQL